jgi:hypothetical protein
MVIIIQNLDIDYLYTLLRYKSFFLGLRSSSIAGMDFLGASIWYFQQPPGGEIFLLLAISFLFRLTLYFYFFTKTDILKIIKKAVIFKIIITIIYYLFFWFGFEGYFIFLTVAIFLGIFWTLYSSKKEDRFYRFLILIYIFLFWLVLNFLLSYLNTFNFLDWINSPYLLLTGYSLYFYNSFDFLASVWQCQQPPGCGARENDFFNGDLDSDSLPFRCSGTAGTAGTATEGVLAMPGLATEGERGAAPVTLFRPLGALALPLTQSPGAAGLEPAEAAFSDTKLDPLFNSISAPEPKMFLREPLLRCAGGATNPNNYLDSAERAPNPNPNSNPNPNPDNGLNSGNFPDLNVGGPSANSLPIEAKQVEILTSPYIFKYHIHKLSEAIKEEIEKSGKKDPYNPYKLVSAWLKAGNIDEKEFKILNNLLENNKFDEFNFKRIGWNYLKDFNKIVILDNKIYVTEVYAKYLMTPDQITEAQNNSIFYAPKIKYSFPVVKEVEKTVQASVKNITIASASSAAKGQTCSVEEKYLFYSSITDLLNSDSREKIDIRNKTIVPFDKMAYAQQWNFFKENYYIWFIENTVGSFLNYSLYYKDPLNEVTPEKLYAAKLTDIFDYSEELEALKRVEKGMEEVLGIKHPNLSDCRPCHCAAFGEKDSGADQARAKELSCAGNARANVDYYFQYWVRQIAEYNSVYNLKEEEFYLQNMYHVYKVREELYENILFLQSKILEARWTINTIDKLLPLFGGISGLDTEDKLIDFYNKLFELYQIEILSKYKETYEFRREYIVSRHVNMSTEDLLLSYDWLVWKNNHANFKSKLDKEIFHKKVYPEPRKIN